MILTEMIKLSFGNLIRTRLRTFLTILGVVIGIGALSSMVSFGTGMQKNITEAFRQNDLFTSLYITPQEINLQNMTAGGLESVADSTLESLVLTDSVLRSIAELPEVEFAFPEVVFPVKLRYKSSETTTSVQALPATMRDHPPFNRLLAGDFFNNNTDYQAIIRWRTLYQLGFIVQDPENPALMSATDSLDGKRVVAADQLIGDSIQVVTATFDLKEIAANPMILLLNKGTFPVKRTVTSVRIRGIMKETNSFAHSKFSSGLILPIKVGESIPRLGFSNVWDLMGTPNTEGYSSIYVRVYDMNQIPPLTDRLNDMGLHVFSFAEQLKQFRRGFLIMDSILGAIGTIALFVAALGIINTMIMSILERTREIGIMKAIGGSEWDIRLIFFFEAGTIGLIGAVLGLILGWVVTRIANFVANAYFIPLGEPPVDLFYFPLWLIGGAILFSVLLSLAAGLYPAIRASNIDPTHALRHD